nr:DUF11 domain-containing protein [Conexibacter arvalis]
MAGWLAIAVAAAGAVGAAAASAQEPVRLVTFAARWCPDYPDISANRARNNIQESLRDLGPDSLYVAGEATEPLKEQLGQARCTPLPDWSFTLGRSYATRAVVGPWGALARVVDPFDTRIVTRAATPLLDVAGQPTGQSLAGAVTIELTREQARRAATGSSLWLQGGTPDDPVLDRTYPSEYGFGALRCATDNYNGDNVEWISYPSGARHVFCYAYYVKPPPTSGTIVVRKVVDDPQASATQSFRFVGNVSFTPARDFTLSATHGLSGEATFYRAATRAGDEPWTIREEQPPGWRLTDLSCISSSGESVAATDVATAAASIRLAAGDTVTCTYVNALAPPPAATLLLSKLTLGAVDSFGLAVSGGDATQRQTIRTEAPGVAVAAPPLTLAPGSYAIDETVPEATAAGSWSLSSIVCDGEERGTGLPVSITLADAQGSACQLTNRFQAAGAIRIGKRTVGGVGTFGFEVTRDDDLSRSWQQRATTRAPGTTVRATGDDTTGLPLGDYTIVETGPEPAADGSWAIESVVCNGVPVGSGRGRIDVALTAREPVLDCTFTNRMRATAEQPPIVFPPIAPTPPATVPPQGGVLGLARANRPRADLRVTKRVSTPVARPGQRVRYTIVVSNRGPHTARNVSGVEIGPRAREIVSVRISRGRCDTGRRPITCHVRALRPGRRVVLTAIAIAPRRGRLVNHVAVSTSSAEPNLRNNRASAVLSIRRPGPRPRYTG